MIASDDLSRIYFLIKVSASSVSGILSISRRAESLSESRFVSGSRRCAWKEPALCAIPRRYSPWVAIGGSDGTATETVHSHLIDDGFP